MGGLDPHITAIGREILGSLVCGDKPQPRARAWQPRNRRGDMHAGASTRAGVCPAANAGASRMLFVERSDGVAAARPTPPLQLCDRHANHET